MYEETQDIFVSQQAGTDSELPLDASWSSWLYLYEISCESATICFMPAKIEASEVPLQTSLRCEIPILSFLGVLKLLIGGPKYTEQVVKYCK